MYRPRRIGLQADPSIQPLHRNAHDKLAPARDNVVDEEVHIYAPPADSSSESSDDERISPPADSGSKTDDDEDIMLMPPKKRKKVDSTRNAGHRPAVTEAAGALVEDEPFLIGSQSKKNPLGKSYTRKNTNTSQPPRSQSQKRKNTEKSPNTEQVKEDKIFKKPPYAHIETKTKAEPSGFKPPTHGRDVLAHSTKNKRSRPKSEFQVPIAPALKVINATGLQSNDKVRRQIKNYTSASSITGSPSAASTLSTPLSSPVFGTTMKDLGDDDSLLMLESNENSSLQSKPCPICGEKIEVSQHGKILDEVQPKPASDFDVCQVETRPRLNMRQQARFCRRHREETAKESWKQRGYPDIDWSSLPERVQDLDTQLRKMIETGANNSVFLESIKREGGQSSGRSTRKRNEAGGKDSGRRHKVSSEVTGSFGAEDVGYYGGRGARAVGEALVQAYAGLFREASGRSYEAIASAGGVNAFVQRVLVPEVIVRLVMQDLRCRAPRAREILIESAELGKLLCEDENDEVVDDEDNL